MGDLGAFRGARRALRRKPVPRWQMGEARAVLGEGGYGKVFPVSDDVVVKVVAINGDYTDETDMRAAGLTENPFDLHPAGAGVQFVIDHRSVAFPNPSSVHLAMMGSDVPREPCARAHISAFADEKNV